MDWEAFKKHKAFAGEKKPSMLRRRVGHDYEQRCVYLVTMTVEGRRPLLGRLVGDAGAESGSSDAPHIELSPLGKQVREMWEAISEYYPEVRVLATMVMPDHLHGILFVERAMNQPLGMVIKGFKAGCNKAYRQAMAAGLIVAAKRTPARTASSSRATTTTTSWRVRASWNGGSGTWQTTLGDWLSSANTQSSSP